MVWDKNKWLVNISCLCYFAEQTKYFANTNEKEYPEGLHPELKEGRG